MPREFAPAEPAPDYTGIGKLKQKDKFAKLVREKRALDREKKQIEERAKEKAEDLLAMMVVAKVERVAVDGVPVSVVHGRGASRIDPQRLLANGVSADTITASTVPGKEYDYINVGKEVGFDD